MLGAAGCADTYTTAPVYRGAYYAYDAYPFGYNGYPGFPYYGAPFGGGASALVVASSGYESSDGDKGRRTRHDGSRRRHARRASSAHRSTSPEETAPIQQR